MNEITVRFRKKDGSWDEEVTFKVDPEQSDLENNIVSVKTPLAKAVSQLKVNQIGKLSTGESFLVVNKSYARTLQGYLNKLKKLEKSDDNDLIRIGSEFPLLLAKAIHIPKKTKKLVGLIISAKLNKEDVSVCMDWLFQLKKSGIYVDDILNKLSEIQLIKNGLEVENINDVYTLHQISNIYRDLQAYKKTKQILLKSLQLNNRNTITLTKLGKISKLTGFFQEGIDFYSQALEIKENAYSYNGLGAIYRELNKLQKAEKCYLSSLELEGDHDPRVAHKGIGAVYYDMKLYEKGNEHFLQADFDEFYLWDIYYDAERKNLHEKCVEVLRLILRFDKNHVHARKLLEYNAQ